MPSRYPVEVRRQVVELARSGTRVAIALALAGPVRVDVVEAAAITELCPWHSPSASQMRP
jgi:hypothetical protein